jgi:hypothetical protein
VGGQLNVVYGQDFRTTTFWSSDYFYYSVGIVGDLVVFALVFLYIFLFGLMVFFFLSEMLVS